MVPNHMRRTVHSGTGYALRTLGLHLVRHASALNRSGFDGFDLDRPLSDLGLRQASTLVSFFDDAPIRAIWSSRATRCLQTVGPLAAAHNMEVNPVDLLTEGARAVGIVEALRDEAATDGDLVLCSHGDLIPEALNRLLRDGMSIIGARGCENGSVWTLDTRGRDIVSGVYTAKPGVSG